MTNSSMSSNQESNNSATQMIPNIDVRTVGALKILSDIWDELFCSETIDSAVSCDTQVLLKPSLALKTLVLNVLCGRDPLYRIQSWLAELPVSLILGQEIDLENFNDTSLGRHLDRFFDADMRTIFNSCCLQVVQREEIAVSRLHGDTTSRLVYGTYQHDGEDVALLARGHSKDNRPDLKQLMFGLVTSVDGVPVFGDVLPGNTSDKTWHGSVMPFLPTMAKQVHYVGDSALATSANLSAAAKNNITITTRLPRNFSAHDAVICRVIHEKIALTEIGKVAMFGSATYSGCIIPDCKIVSDDGTEHKVQLGVYQSNAANERTASSMSALLQRQMKRLQQAADTLSSTLFSCKPDAEDALQHFINDHTAATDADQLLNISGKVVASEVVKAKRGRPAKNAGLATSYGYAVQVEITEDSQRIAAASRQKSFFVLLHTGREAITAEELLRIYKGQSVVETRFPFLKDPAMTEVFFVKSAHRVEVLGYIMLLALLLWSVWERRVRLNLEASKEAPIRDTTGMKKNRPTATVCRHIMSSFKVYRVEINGVWSHWQQLGALRAEQERVLRFSRAIRSTVKSDTQR
jgi:transposase